MNGNGKRWLLIATVWTLGYVCVTSHSADQKAEYLKDCPLEVGTAGPAPWARHPAVHSVVNAHLEKVRGVFVDARAGSTSSEVEQLMMVLSSTVLLPRNGVLHVAEPREEYYFVLLPLLARPDIKVLVTDVKAYLELFYFRWIDSEWRYFEGMFDEIKLNNPALLKLGGGLENAEALAKFLRARLWIRSGDGSTAEFNHTPAGSTGGPGLADLAILPHPEDSASEVRASLKRGGLAWLITKNLDRRASAYRRDPQIDLPPAIGEFYPGEPDGKPGSTRAYAVAGARGYLMSVLEP